MEPAFVPDDFEVPLSLEAGSFRLEPLGPQHNDRDHEAWMSSIDHINSTPGFPDGLWPAPMTLEANRNDLVRHADDFAARRGFTYSVLEGSDVVGCVYIYPHADSHDAEIQSWVRADKAELDGELWRKVSTWLQEAWPFTDPYYAPRS